MSKMRLYLWATKQVKSWVNNFIICVLLRWSDKIRDEELDLLGTIVGASKLIHWGPQRGRSKLAQIRACPVSKEWLYQAQNSAVSGAIEVDGQS